jgi:hypothetical protein
VFITSQKNTQKEQFYDKYFSYHDLFSKDSGIMEFIEWKRNDLITDLDGMLDASD